ncbi:hypothetical protein H310_09655 [Aphanomyces invadans]|uniref:Urea transporter n=1 Tax=Aphanomyces invadans TaxID=157072 RepID=A0A024TVC6_9STRA|nr:hypothetical protein H310_09655 [Aphanomyces invadans]ETV97307.1 hypothetical protein H310_09655 [Aphanomyces invadans]|eukprot:XP_008874015.1 hypothetical protein H310_09655 [Aphanomyces invadans]
MTRLVTASSPSAAIPLASSSSSRQTDPYHDVTARPPSTWLKTVAPFRTLPQTRAATGRIVSFVDICLRSFGQCCFQNSPLTGLVFVVALATSAHGPAMVGLALLGCMSANLFAITMGFHEPLIAAGLFGYNATLVGCAFQAFVVGDAPWTWEAHAHILVAVPCLSVLSVLVASAASSVLPPGTPGLTIAFQVTVWSWLLATHTWSPAVAAPFAPSPGLYMPLHGSAAAVATARSYDMAKVQVAVASGVAQCCLASEWYVGLAMVVGIALCSPISAFYAAVGSTVGTFMAVAVGAPPEQIYLGLYGFNGALCAIALGGFFVLANGVHPNMLVAVGILGSTLLMSTTIGAFGPVGLPALSWPFTFMTWCILVSATSMKRVVLIPLDELQTPEDHWEHHHERTRRTMRPSHPPPCFDS